MAALEVRVHLDLPFELLPADFVLLSVKLPESPLIRADDLADTVAFGDAWLTAAQSVLLRAPSALVPHAWNILLNPLHPGAAEASVGQIEPFNFDPRLWRPLASEA